MLLTVQSLCVRDQIALFARLRGHILKFPLLGRYSKVGNKYTVLCVPYIHTVYARLMAYLL